MKSFIGQKRNKKVWNVNASKNERDFSDFMKRSHKEEQCSESGWTVLPIVIHCSDRTYPSISERTAHRGSKVKGTVFPDLPSTSQGIPIEAAAREGSQPVPRPKAGWAIGRLAEALGLHGPTSTTLLEHLMRPKLLCSRAPRPNSNFSSTVQDVQFCSSELKIRRSLEVEILIFL